MKKDYLQSLNIKQFRGIKNLQLNNFNNFNIILGGNNVGKTTILECIRIIGANDIDYIYNIGSRNKNNIVGNLNNLVYLFPRDKKEIKIDYKINNQNSSFSMNYDLSQVIFNPAIFATDDNKPENQLRRSLVSSLKLENRNVDQIYGEINDNGQKIQYSCLKYDFAVGAYRTNKKFNIKYISPFSHFTSNDALIGLAITNQTYKKLMIDVLKLFEKDIVDIISAPVSEEFSEYEIFLVKENKDNMPLKFFGDGMKKFVELASDLVHAKDGILLIDEIETSLHHTMFDDIFYFLLKGAKQFNIQLFITTHNKETIETLIELESKHFKGEMNVYTINKKDGISYAKLNSASNIYELFLNGYIDVRN